MKARLWLLLSLLAAGITWLYMSRILLPWEHYINVECGWLKPELGDLYPRWVGTRELLLHGRNPYGADVSHEIQMAFYGHPIEQKYGQPGVELIDEQRFVYPVYVVFFMAPTLWCDFFTLQAWVPVFFALLTAISVLLWQDVLRWRPPKTVIAAIVLFVVASPQIMQGLRLRQLGLMVAFLLALGAWCIVRNRLAIAGIILALSTVKPQMVVLQLVWLLVWGVNAWPKRWPLVAGFSATLAILVGMGEMILPGWPSYFLDGLVAYRQYFPTTSLLCLAIGNRAGGILSGIMVVGLMVLAFRNRQAEATSPEFVQTLAAFFIGATLILPLLTPYNQVLLVLPALMILHDWTSFPRTPRRVLAILMAWPWITALLLLLVHPRLDSPHRVPLIPSDMVLIQPFFFFMLLAKQLTRSHYQPVPATDLRLQ